MRIRLRRAKEAQAALREDVCVSHAAFGENHISILYGEYWLAQSLALGGDLAAAIELLRPVQERASASHAGEAIEPRICEFLADLVEQSGDKTGAMALRR